VRELHLQAGEFHLGALDFTIPTGRYAVLMGRSGSGKTTLLETLCGLRPAARGCIRFDGQDITRWPPAARDIGYVPQDRALFQTMTVWDHLAFALRVRGWPREARARRVHELAELLGIGDLLHRKPQGLSGGEAQRVALGRALSFRPRVLCLDEPLSALDDQTREEMYELLKSVQRHTGVTTFHVTHHRGEADRLADLVFRIENGQLISETHHEDSATQPSRPHA